MTSEPVVGVVFGRPVEGKTTLSYICLPFHSPTQASQLTGTSSYYRFRCHYPLITYLSLNNENFKGQMKFDTPFFSCFTVEKYFSLFELDFTHNCTFFVQALFITKLSARYAIFRAGSGQK